MESKANRKKDSPSEVKSTQEATDANKAPDLKEEILKESEADLKETLTGGQTEAKLDELQKSYDAMEDKYLRAEAEMANMHTRFNKEREQLVKYEGQKVVTAVLPVLDNLERALAVEVSDENGEQLKKGVQMVFEHLQQALTENSVTEIEALNQPFDPNIHQAVQTVPVQGDQKPDTVVKVLQKGYRLKDRVIRPAMVIVSQ